MRRSDVTEYAFGPYAVRAGEWIARFDGQAVPLAPKVVDTLVAFLDEPGRIVSKGELMERIWPDSYVDEANLTQNIYLLRKMFAEHRSGVRIENVPKRGYRLAGSATVALLVETKPALQPASRRIALGTALAAILACAAGVVLMFPPAAQVATTPYGLPPAGLQDYIVGRDYLNRGTAPALRQSVAAFARLARLVPRSALGYAGLAEAYTSETFASADVTERALLTARAIALAGRAVDTDGNCAEAYAALGAVETSLEHDDAAAARSFGLALRLDPRDLDALVWYGTALMNGGRVAEARQLFQRAASIAPSSPGAIASLAWADFLERDYPAAAAFSQQLLRAHRLESIARLTLASSYVEMRDYRRALAEITVLEQMRDTRTQGVALRSQVYTLRGQSKLALDTLARLDAHTDPDVLGPWDVLALAAAYARLGKDDLAFVWLARVHPSERRQLARDPRFDLLRRDRRFNGWLSG